MAVEVKVSVSVDSEALEQDITELIRGDLRLFAEWLLDEGEMFPGGPKHQRTLDNLVEDFQKFKEAHV